ncbi:MAG: sulfite exporter TauE/SafE family protein, partial [Gillisia sp.]
MDPLVLTFILLVLLSVAISSFGNIVGFGGGVFMVPLLVSFFHFPFTIAVGSVMISLVPSSLIATYFRRKEGFVDFRMGILLEIPTMAGVVLGSFLLTYVKVEILEIIFSLFIIGVGISFLKKKKDAENSENGIFYKLNRVPPRFIIKNNFHYVAYRASIWLVLFFGLLSGTLAGLFGIGGGFLKTPIMIKVFQIPAKIATATALFMIIITSLTGSVTHYLNGHIIFEKALPIIIGFSVGALLGRKFNLAISSKTLERLIGISLIVAA